MQVNNQPTTALVGEKYHRLTVIEVLPRTQRRCRCDCGKEVVVFRTNLRRGFTQSCGCFGMSQRTVHGQSRGKNGLPASTYYTWNSMLRRCYTPSTTMFEHYGGRGITVCERWRHSFENFLEDMGERPGPEYSLDRFPNNNGNYELGNCRWATRREQMNNTRMNVAVEFRGDTRTIAEWSRLKGWPHYILQSRLKSG